MRLQPILCICPALAWGVSAAAQEAHSPLVISALADNQYFDKDRNLFYFELSNLGNKTISGYFLRIYCTTADGVEHFVGRAGRDMIDYPDPMPEAGVDNTQVLPFGRVGPHLRKRTSRNMSECEGAPAVNTRAELEAVVFDDGSSEGTESQQLKLLLEARKIKRAELAKWVDRFKELRRTADLSAASRRLYEDLVAANHESDRDPDIAARNATKIAGGVRDDLQDLALEITQCAKVHKTIDDLPDVVWRINELEKRYVRLKLATGAAEAEPG